jgi:hypothetical protein
MTPTHLVAVTEWLNWVAQGTGLPSGSDPEAVIKTRAVMVGEKYPDTRMFCQASAAFVAIECGLMSLPSVGILGKFLEKWWSKNQPALIALPGLEIAAPADAPLTPADRNQVDSWLRGVAGGKASDSDLAGRLSIVRKVAPVGFNWLVRNNHTAGAIAARLGWIANEQGEAEDDYTDPKAILVSVRNILEPPHPQANYWLKALRAAVERKSPHLAGLVPLSVSDTVSGSDVVGPNRQPTQQQRAEMAADAGIVKVDRPSGASVPGAAPHGFVVRFEAVHGRKPGALSAEQLAAVRENNPALKAVMERQAAEQAVDETETKVEPEANPGIGGDSLRPALSWDDPPPQQADKVVPLFAWRA